MAVKKVEKEEIIDDIVVNDPLVYKPVELPLVVKPAEGKDWKNPQQAEYAKTVNAYAYKNAKKWAENRIGVDGKEIPNSSKKEILLKRLKEIGDNPSMLAIYNGGGNGNLTFTNKLVG